MKRSINHDFAPIDLSLCTKCTIALKYLAAIILFAFIALVLTSCKEAHNKKELNESLCFHAEMGDADKVSVLLGNGADVNTRCGPDSTPLGNAVVGNSFAKNADYAKVCTILLSRGANVNGASGDIPPIIRASDKADVIQILLAKGADVNTKNKDGGTPLMYAAAKGSFFPIQILLAKGANVNAKDNSGATPLIYAVQGSRLVGVVQILLDKGADVHAKDELDFTAADYAYTFHASEIVSLLKKHGGKTDLPYLMGR